MKVCTNTVLFSAFLHDTLLIENSELNLTSFPRWGCVLEVHAWHLWTLGCNCPLYVEGPLITPSFPPSSSFHLPPVFLFSICHLHNLLYYSALSKAWFYLFIYLFLLLPLCPHVSWTSFADPHLHLSDSLFSASISLPFPFRVSPFLFHFIPNFFRSHSFPPVTKTSFTSSLPMS